MKKTSILFVCMGNICRSPTAEGVFRARAERAGLAANLHIDSAGTHAYHVGHQPDRRSMQFASLRGYDLSTQRARQVAASDFAAFDHIYAMDHENLERLTAACAPQHRHKLGLFMQFASDSHSDVVPDPYYGDGNGFDLVLDYIEDASDGLLAVLQSGDKAIVVTASETGLHAADSEFASAEELIEFLKSRHVTKIELHADERGGYEQIGKVIYGCQRAGIELQVVSEAQGG